MSTRQNNPSRVTPIVWENATARSWLEFLPEVLEEIRLAVVDAFYALPRGGLEMGGVLTGTANGARVCVTGWAPIACAHQSGPSFLLSEQDQALLAGQLGSLRAQGRHVVGWFQSHTRSEMVMSEADIAVHRRFFPDPASVAVLFKPDHMRPLRGLFLAGPAGSLLASREFMVDVGSREQQAARIPPPVPPPPVPQPVREFTPPRFTQLAAEKNSSAKSPTVPPVSIPNRRLLWWAVGALTLLLLVTAVFAASVAFKPVPPEPLRLETAEAEGRLLIRWNANADAVRRATAGKLTISEGTDDSTVNLDPAQLARGFHLYTRRSERTKVQLTVTGSGSAPAEDVAMVTGPPPPQPPCLGTSKSAELQRKKDDREKAALLLENQGLRLRVKQLAQQQVPKLKPVGPLR